MPKQKILFVTQEIAPYIPDGDAARLGRYLPQDMQSKKNEVRTFMPNLGTVNERRNQLHEVIRLSGMNISLNDTDHPLLIKVASLQPSRIQVYFIDNDDYFQKLESDIDVSGSNREDNPDRAIFFAHGTMSTATKLRWEPNVIQCTGWLSALAPLYFKRMFEDNSFKKSKIVYSILPEQIPTPVELPKQVPNPSEEQVPNPSELNELNSTSSEEPEQNSITFAKDLLITRLKEDGVKPADLKKIQALETDDNLVHRIALLYADAVVFHADPDPALVAMAEELGIPYTRIPINDPETGNLYSEFYSTLK